MPQFDPRITFGNLLTMFAMVVTALAVFLSMQNATAANAEKMTRQDAAHVDHETRIRVIENTLTGSLARIDARLSSIEKEVAK